jgi:hypothetical protein
LGCFKVDLIKSVVYLLFFFIQEPYFISYTHPVNISLSCSSGWGCIWYFYVSVAGNNPFVQALLIKMNIGATFQDFNSGVLILEDGTCLTFYKLYGSQLAV